MPSKSTCPPCICPIPTEAPVSVNRLTIAPRSSDEPSGNLTCTRMEPSGTLEACAGNLVGAKSKHAAAATVGNQNLLTGPRAGPILLKNGYTLPATAVKEEEDTGLGSPGERHSTARNCTPVRW